MGDYVGCVFLVVGYYVSHCVGCMHGIFCSSKTQARYRLYTRPFRSCYNRVPKGDAPLKPRTMQPFLCGSTNLEDI
uniref:Uncharacterized protein n=1 Tax=Escherichia coli TaxID=562 RepID=A0A5P9WC34_ECOLX|nr:hypothetical protein [Escherichia coli]